MDRPKQKRVWIDQDVIDSPLYVIIKNVKRIPELHMLDEFV